MTLSLHWIVMKKKGGDDEATQGPHQNQFSYFIKRDGFINKKIWLHFSAFLFCFRVHKIYTRSFFCPSRPLRSILCIVYPLIGDNAVQDNTKKERRWVIQLSIGKGLSSIRIKASKIDLLVLYMEKAFLFILKEKKGQIIIWI